MERMWSPWRSRHIERAHASAEDEGGSLFARLLAEEQDEKNYILWRGPHVFVIMNLYPYNNGHIMIVPNRVVATYEALTVDEQVEMARVLDRCIRWLRHALRPEGFNVGMNLGLAGGAGIPDHLHMHVVPRWRGDTNFMPTIGDIKVVPEALENTYHKLRQAIRDVDAHPPDAG